MRQRARLLAPLVGLLVGILAVPLPASAATAIDGCTTITSRGDYVLTRDVAASSDLCITITASDVALSLDGHTLTGPVPNRGTSIGILVQPRAGRARVTDGTATGFSVGVLVVGALVTVSGVTARADTEGIVLDHAVDSDVTKDTASGNSMIGIEVRGGSSRDRIESDTADDNSVGILAGQDTKGNLFEGNTAMGNSRSDLRDLSSNCGLGSGITTGGNIWRGNTFGTSFSGVPGCIH